MAESIELRFCDKLQENYKKCQKYLINKDIYYKTIEDIKAASESSKTKSRYDYYSVWSGCETDIDIRICLQKSN